MKKYSIEWTILSIAMGATTGVLLASKNTNINVIGIAIIIITVFLLRHNLKELFWRTESDKLMSLILVAVIGMTFIIVSKTLTGIAVLLTGAWAILVIRLFAQLWGIVANINFNLETKQAEIEHLELQNAHTTYLLKKGVEGKWAIEFVKKTIAKYEAHKEATQCQNKSD